MKQKTQIRSLQAAAVIFAGTVGTVYFPLAAVLVPLVKTTSWLIVVIIFLLTTLWTLLVTWLAKQAPSGNFGVAVEVWLGPVVGKIFLLWFAAYWLLISSGVLSEVSFVFHIVALPATPIGVLQVAFLLLLMYTDWHGIETCARAIEALLMLKLPLIFSFLLAALAASKWSNLLPLLDADPVDLAKATYLVSPYPLAGVLITLFLTVKVQDREQVAVYNVLASWLAGLLLSIVVAVTIAVLGCCVTESYVYPTIPLAQSITVGQTLVGVEILVYPLWLLSGYIKSALAFVIASSTVRAILPALKQPWRTFGLGLIVIVIAMLPQNLRGNIYLLNIANFYLGVPFYLVIPGIAIWVKLKKRGKQYAE